MSMESKGQSGKKVDPSKGSQAPPPSPPPKMGTFVTMSPQRTKGHIKGSEGSKRKQDRWKIRERVLGTVPGEAEAGGYLE